MVSFGARGESVDGRRYSGGFSRVGALILSNFLNFRKTFPLTLRQAVKRFAEAGHSYSTQ